MNKSKGQSITEFAQIFEERLYGKYDLTFKEYNAIVSSCRYAVKKMSAKSCAFIADNDKKLIDEFFATVADNMLEWGRKDVFKKMRAAILSLYGCYIKVGSGADTKSKTLPIEGLKPNGCSVVFDNIVPIHSIDAGITGTHKGRHPRDPKVENTYISRIRWHQWYWRNVLGLNPNDVFEKSVVWTGRFNSKFGTFFEVYMSKPEPKRLSAK